MDWLQAIILGIIQGVTEFLPISSSGHLVFGQHLLGVETPNVLLAVVLHMGTLMAILIYYYNDIKQLLQSVINGNENARKFIIYLIIATIPILFAGLLFSNIIEATFTVSIVRWMLMITGVVVGSTYFFQNRPIKEFVPLKALCIGVCQVFALMPGISRSGLTISVALIMGIQHEKAAKFAFFMAIPVLFGAGLLQLITIDSQSNMSLLPLIIGFISSAFSGYLVINWLLAVISWGKFYYFSLYCFIISLLAFTIIN